MSITTITSNISIMTKMANENNDINNSLDDCLDIIDTIIENIDQLINILK